MLEISFTKNVSLRKNNISHLLADFLEKAQTNNMPKSYEPEEAFTVAHYAAKFKDRLYAAMTDGNTTVSEKLEELIQMDISENMRKAITEIITSEQEIV